MQPASQSPKSSSPGLVSCTPHTEMDEAFERKLRAAVSAGWRVLIVEVGLLTLAWVAYLAIMGAHPPALLALWGPDVTWSTVAAISLEAIAIFKVALWLQAVLLAWGAVWASRLALSARSASLANRGGWPPGRRWPG